VGVLADYVIRHHYPHLKEQGEQAAGLAARGQPGSQAGGSCRSFNCWPSASLQQRVSCCLPCCALYPTQPHANLCPPALLAYSVLRCAVRLSSLCRQQQRTLQFSHCLPRIPSLYRCAGGGGNKYAAFLTEVAQRTGRLFAEWHRVGFTHGVLNTDNMSIMGDTIGGWCGSFCLGLGVEGGEFILHNLR
jgi:uncharacterized protein YdiU (UPF0061 family)